MFDDSYKEISRIISNYEYSKNDLDRLINIVTKAAVSDNYKDRLWLYGEGGTSKRQDVDSIVIE